MQKKPSSYEIIDHGIENEQYFQGCGTAFTDYDHVATGIGSSAKEAYEDAAENMAQQGFEETDEMKAEAATLSTEFDLPKAETEEEEDNDNYADGVWHYVSIRWAE